MSQSLSRSQAVALGFVVLLALVLGGYGVARIADKQGLWVETVELAAGFPEAHDVTPGTPVRVRGVEAGQVVAVEYPDHDGPGAEVTVRMRVQARFAARLYANAAAHVHANGLLGAKVIAIRPGDPGAGPLAGGRLRGVKPFDMADAVADVRALAADGRAAVNSARELIDGVRAGDGTLGKLVRDDALYDDARKVLARADKALGAVEGEMGALRGFVADGRDTLKSVKQGTDAIGKMPIVRNYVEDHVALLVRPTMGRERWTFEAKHLFEPGTAVLSEAGTVHMTNMAALLNERKVSGSEVVVAAFAGADEPVPTAAVALELSRKRAEVAAAFLRAEGAHKLGTLSRRKVVPLGMGTAVSPAEPEPDAPAHVQVLLFVPK